MKEENLEASVSNDTWQSGGVHIVNKTGSLIPSHRRYGNHHLLYHRRCAGGSGGYLLCDQKTRQRRKIKRILPDCGKASAFSAAGDPACGRKPQDNGEAGRRNRYISGYSERRTLHEKTKSLHCVFSCCFFLQGCLCYCTRRSATGGIPMHQSRAITEYSQQAENINREEYEEDVARSSGVQCRSEGKSRPVSDDGRGKTTV